MDLPYSCLLHEQEPAEFTEIKVKDPLKQSETKLRIGISENTFLPRSGLLVLPSGIDLHVHFREPGYTWKEDFKSGSVAALAGGITLAVDMPNTNPPVTTVERLEEKKQLRDRNSRIPTIIAGAIVEENRDDLPSLSRETSVLKAFLGDSFGKLHLTFEGFAKALSILSRERWSGVVFIHAEDPHLFNPDAFPEDHWKTRPEKAEVVAVKKVLKIAKDYPSVRIHLTHLSSANSVEFVRKNNAEGYSTVSYDVTPAHLEFHKDSLIQESWKLKRNPPIRPKPTMERLRKFFLKGELFALASDHAPHTIEEKMSADCPPGAPGVQELYPFLLDYALREVISLHEMIDMIRTNPLRVLRHIKTLPHKLLVNPNDNAKINESWIKSKVGWSLWEGRILRGKIVGVLCEHEREHFLIPQQKETLSQHL